MPASLSQEIAPHLPYLRRYARALTGSQQSGDAHVTACLEAIVADPSILELRLGTKVALFRLFQELWHGLGIEPGETSGLGAGERTARERLARMAPESRQVLLLTTLEGFRPEDAAAITGRSEADVHELIAAAADEIDRQIATRVLIIEDEPLISLDLAEIVESLGHEVSTIARTAGQAVQAAGAETPGLVLADIQLADGSSGLDAVREILTMFEVPVIFITSFPERLLTGKRPEPTFLITKPYDPNAVKAAISQALFFRTAASLDA
ncbi:MAG: response regulator [Amaricoccus sp.]|uniref:response regulator n=1 Tax=Amaricoccus sp. TaxID=1872485 RepID=UPI0039E375F7